jgi:hypothetical protein
MTNTVKVYCRREDRTLAHFETTDDNSPEDIINAVKEQFAENNEKMIGVPLVLIQGGKND